MSPAASPPSAQVITESSDRVVKRFRRFRISDAFALVFAAALTFSVCPQFHPVGISLFEATSSYDFFHFANTTLVVFTCVLAAVAIADGARCRGSIQQPGRTCLIALATVILLAPLTDLNGLQIALSSDSIGQTLASIIQSTVLNESNHWAWPTVIATGLVLLIQQRRIEFSDWLDAAGLLVGASWVAYSMAIEIYNYWPF